jgi:uncharacterized protein YijF (DUF1287 family)
MNRQSKRTPAIVGTSLARAASRLQCQNKSIPPAVLILCLILIFNSSCGRQSVTRNVTRRAVVAAIPPAPVERPLSPTASPQLKQFVAAAIEQSKVTTGYDPSYVKIDYPNGDVSSDSGVCSDVIVRAFRKAGIDLQKEVHEDMVRAWSEYPRKWGARGTDTSIDHRRVLNLTTWFARQGKALAITAERADYLPGDVVAWELSDDIEHIGIVTNLSSETDKHYLIVHNIGAGARIEDVLLAWKIIGHYRYF